MLTEDSIIHADELTEGDIIRHFTGDLWQVYTEPEYTTRGIEFEVLNLSYSHHDTHKVSFHPEWRSLLVGHQRSCEEVAA